MCKIKLSDYCKKNGISYVTGYRWFKEKKLPVKSEQTSTGTILVEDDDVENNMNITQLNQTNDIMSLILKKTVEFSKNNGSIEDFAAYILSNFSLKLNSTLENPKYSKHKPNSEEVQKHFQQFIKPIKDKPKPNMFIADPESFFLELSEDEILKSSISNEIVNDANKNFVNAVLVENRPNNENEIKSYSDSSIGFSSIDSLLLEPSTLMIQPGSVIEFKPTQKEIDSVMGAMVKIADDIRSNIKPKRTKKIFKNK